MNSTIQRYNPPQNGRAALSQATSIEQSRAIADVQAAVTVAQNCPRDMAEAEREMEYVCGRLSVAEQAFYRVQNRGTGPSVHLMRELARIWGNIDYGVKELSRDDNKGESEVLATCWDMQKNTRSSRTFIVPHQRMVKVDGKQQRKELVDLQDIYLNNQNVGARAVRECIETVLPKWFTERAQEVCRATLANGEGEPLTERIQKMVDWFRDRLGVSQQQLETNVGRKRGQWTADDVAQLKISSKSIVAGEIGRDEVFPPIAAETVDVACNADADAAPAASKLTGKVKAAGVAPPADAAPAKPAEGKPKGHTSRVEAALAKAEAAAAEKAQQDQDATEPPAPEPNPDNDKPPLGDRFYREPEPSADASDPEPTGDDQSPPLDMGDDPDDGPPPAPEPEPPRDDRPATKEQLQELTQLIAAAGFQPNEDGRVQWFAFVSQTVGHDVTANNQLTRDEIGRVSKELRDSQP